MGHPAELDPEAQGQVHPVVARGDELLKQVIGDNEPGSLPDWRVIIDESAHVPNDATLNGWKRPAHWSE